MTATKEADWAFSAEELHRARTNIVKTHYNTDDDYGTTT